MKAIIDEGVPRRLATLLRRLGHDVSGFPDRWKGLSNGALLTELERGSFDCLLTCDRNLYLQQNIARRKLSVLVLPAQRFEDLQPNISFILAALADIRPGRVVHVERRSPQPPHN